MKSMIVNLWVWVLAHPEAVGAAALAVLSVVAATVANARAQDAPTTWFERFVDRVSVRTRANASNAGWSWPVIGRSIFEAALDASAPPKDPPSEPGFVDRAVLWIIGGIALLALGAMMLGGCAAASNPMLSPIAPRLIDRPEYGRCIETGGKLQVPDGPSFALITQACMMMDASVPVDASEPESEAIPDKTDAGAAE